jgi:hypothetical protein
MVISFLWFRYDEACSGVNSARMYHYKTIGKGAIDFPHNIEPYRQMLLKLFSRYCAET